MNKKKMIIISLSICIVLLISYLLFFHNIINSNFATNTFVKFSNIEEIIDKDDIGELKQILKGRTFRDSPACGFSNEISITMSDEKRSIRFCPALDGDPIIRINDSDRYIYISEEQRKRLDKILEKYGMTFPCI